MKNDGRKVKEKKEKCERKKEKFSDNSINNY